MARETFDTTDHPYGESVGHLINEFAKLPGIGRKSAERLTHHVLATPADEATGLAEAIRQVKESIRFCAICFNLTEAELCAICRDSRRSRQVVCVVEQPRDVVSLEAAGVYEGVYHVLGGALAPLSGIGPEQLRIEPLLRRVREEGVTEVVITNVVGIDSDGSPATEGDTSATEEDSEYVKPKDETKKEIPRAEWAQGDHLEVYRRS